MAADILALLVQDAIVALLQGAIPDVTPTKDADLPQPGAGRLLFLNVVLSGQPVQVLAEAMGIDEDESEIEYVQTFNLEWIVRHDDAELRRVYFAQGLAAVDAAVKRDRTLGGLAHGMTVGPLRFDVNPRATSPATQAALIPLRVALRGTSLIS